MVNNTKVCAVIDQIRALDKQRFLQCDAVLSVYEIDLIDNGLCQVLVL
jgi:hypothetical protein